MNCPHQPSCPRADAPDREAAHVVAAHPEQGWSLLCNGVVVFEDTGDLLPDGRIIAPHRAASDLDLVTFCGSRCGPTGSSRWLGDARDAGAGPVHRDQPEDERASRNSGKHGQYGGPLARSRGAGRVQLHRAWAALHRGQPR